MLKAEGFDIFVKSIGHISVYFIADEQENMHPPAIGVYDPIFTYPAGHI